MREAEPKNSNPEKPLGLEAQNYVEDFVEQAFPEAIVIERTETFDPNDMNGVDFVCRVRDGQSELLFAVDVTFASDPRRDFKMKKTFQKPIAELRDSAGKPTGERAPRILFYERSTALWTLAERRAEEAGTRIIDAMSPKERKDQQLRFLGTVVGQAKNLSAVKGNKEYAERMAPVIKLFSRKIKEIEDNN